MRRLSPRGAALPAALSSLAPCSPRPAQAAQRAVARSAGLLNYTCAATCVDYASVSLEGRQARSR